MRFPSECLSAKKNFLMVAHIKKCYVSIKSCPIFEKNKNGHFIFGSDPSKMDQTRKFGEQTSRILEIKPFELEF